MFEREVLNYLKLLFAVAASNNFTAKEKLIRVILSLPIFLNLHFNSLRPESTNKREQERGKENCPLEKRSAVKPQTLRHHAPCIVVSGTTGHAFSRKQTMIN